VRKRLNLIWLSIIIVAIIIFLPIIVFYSQRQQNTQSKAFNPETSTRKTPLQHNGYIVEFADTVSLDEESDTNADVLGVRSDSKTGPGRAAAKKKDS